MERTRIAAVALIWIVFCVLVMTTLIVQGEAANFIIIGALGLAAWLSTDSVMNTGKKDEEEKTVEISKAKRGENPNTLLSLLDEDDIAELRARVKHRLINSIEGGSDGELSSLDQLLAEQELRQNKR
jgi:hypothetical protein